VEGGGREDEQECGRTAALVAEQLAPEDVGERHGECPDPDHERGERPRSVDAEGVHDEEEARRVARAVDGERGHDLGEAVEEDAGAIGEGREGGQVLVRRLEGGAEDVEPALRAVARGGERHAQHEREGECRERERRRGQARRSQTRGEQRGRGHERGDGRGGPRRPRLDVAHERRERRAQHDPAPVEAHARDHGEGHAGEHRDGERDAPLDSRLAGGGAELGRHGARR
jgi:hypothetical protein